MSFIRRWGLSTLLLCLPTLALPSGAARAAPDNPPGPDAKATDALVRDALRNVINEGADMYNGAPPHYTVPDYLGCHHLYEGALIAVRPLLSSHPDLQKAIDEGLDNARGTPDSTKRAFVLRTVIDQIRDGLKPGGPTIPPPTETTIKGKVTKAEALRLEVKGDDGKLIVFAVSDDAAVTIDGAKGRVDDIKADSTVTVTAKGSLVTKVEAKSPIPIPPPATGATYFGKVVDNDKGKLTVSVDGKDKSFVVPDSAAVTIDDKAAKPEDVKKDSAIKLTLKDDVVVKVEAKAPTPPPPPKIATIVGKVVGVDKDKLTVSIDDKEKVFAVPADAKVTIDEKDGKLADLKKDSTATVTTNNDVVKTIDAKSPPPEIKSSVYVGKVTKVDGNKVTIKTEKGDKDFTITDDKVVKIDGKDGKAADITVDSTAAVTTDKEGKVTAVDVKAPASPDLSDKVTGKVTKSEAGKISVKPDTGEAREFRITDDKVVMIDGKLGKAADIKAGSTATVVTDKDGKITSVDVKAPAAPPPPQPETKTSGKVLKVVGAKLTVLPVTGEAKDFTVPDDAAVTLDGKDAKLIDVKADSTVTVTTKGDAVVKVEAKAAVPPPPPPAQTLWDRLGGETGVAKVVDDFVNTAAKDPKVNFYRDPTHVPSKEEVAALKTKLVEFVSVATGGSLKYSGKDMKEVHKGMKITDAEFDAAAADLKAALEKGGVKADDVKAVLNAVEGTRKDIVEVK